MRKAILMVLLAVVSSSAAAAEWVKIGKLDTGIVLYVDPTSIRRNTNTVKMWELHDIGTAQTLVDGRSFLSRKVQIEYDCKEDQVRTRYITYYSGNMGEGELVRSASVPGEWRPVIPDSGVEILWKLACGKL